jgi:hypothetical protein
MAVVWIHSFQRQIAAISIALVGSGGDARRPFCEARLATCRAREGLSPKIFCACLTVAGICLLWLLPARKRDKQMKLSKLLCARDVGRLVIVALCVSLVAARAQKYEITPLVGGSFFGTPHLEQPDAPNFYAQLADSITYGVAGGYRVDGQNGDGHDEVEFRWMRQNSHLSLPQNPIVPSSPSSFRPSVNIDSFFGDFTHEFDLQEGPKIAPFVTGSLGAAVLSAPASSATRFTFGVGAGVKIFPAARWGFRLWAEYQPIVMHTELQRVVCAAGCVVILNGGIINQFQVSIGPAFRF